MNKENKELIEELERSRKGIEKSENSLLRTVAEAKNQRENILASITAIGLDKNKLEIKLNKRLSSTIDESTSKIREGFIGENTKRIREGFK